MKCPRCNKEGAVYINRHKEFYKNKVKGKDRERMARINNIGRCKICGYEGEI